MLTAGEGHAEATSTHLSIKVVGEALHKLALNGLLAGQQGQVVGQLVMCGDDGALPIRVKLGPAGTAKDLQHIQDAQVHEGTLLGIVDLCSLETGQQQQEYAAVPTNPAIV